MCRGRSGEEARSTRSPHRLHPPDRLKPSGSTGANALRSARREVDKGDGAIAQRTDDRGEQCALAATSRIRASSVSLGRGSVTLPGLSGSWWATMQRVPVSPAGRAGLGRAGRLKRGQGPPARRRRLQRGIASIQASRQQALGRSRGGLTTKLHTICDGRGRNLATRLTPGQDADTSQLVGLVDAVRVARPGGRGRPRMRPGHLTGDKAYSSRANRQALRAHRIPHTIPERDDQKANRARKGARGGRRRALTASGTSSATRWSG